MLALTCRFRKGIRTGSRKFRALSGATNRKKTHPLKFSIILYPGKVRYQQHFIGNWNWSKVSLIRKVIHTIFAIVCRPSPKITSVIYHPHIYHSQRGEGTQRECHKIFKLGWCPIFNVVCSKILCTCLIFINIVFHLFLSFALSLSFPFFLCHFLSICNICA